MADAMIERIELGDDMGVVIFERDERLENGLWRVWGTSAGVTMPCEMTDDEWGRLKRKAAAQEELG